MPKRTDLSSIRIIGAGPIAIAQACEFDYSGAQACKALREEGYRVIMVNSNPATIMTDPEMAEVTYTKPPTGQAGERIMPVERPHGRRPPVGAAPDRGWMGRSPKCGGTDPAPRNAADARPRMMAVMGGFWRLAPVLANPRGAL